MGSSIRPLLAAAARRFAGTPERMALMAALIGCAAVGGGVLGSLQFDTPAGPSVVVAALVLFLVGFLVDKIANVRTGPSGSFESDVPVIPIVIKKMSRYTFE